VAIRLPHRSINPDVDVDDLHVRSQRWRIWRWKIRVISI